MSVEQQVTERLCVECGKPILHPAASDLCTWCWMKKNHPETMRREAERLERERLMEELGIPLDALWKKFTLGGAIFGDKWADYSVEAFGMNVDYPPTPENDFPFIRISGPTRFGLIVQLRQQRIRHMTSKVFGELRYYPDRGKTYAIKGDVQEASSKEMRLAQRGLKMLAKAAKQSAAGRPIDSGFVTEENKEDALQLIIETGKKIYRTTGKISQDVIAQKCDGNYGIKDKRAVYRVVTEHCKKDWKKDILPEIKS